MFRAYNLWVTSPPTETPPAALIEAATVIEANLDDSLQASTLPSHLYDAAHYAVVNGGKRVRPALTLLCAQAVGGTQEQAMSAAIAVEFIHCFSLVHDDLPCLATHHSLGFGYFCIYPSQRGHERTMYICGFDLTTSECQIARRTRVIDNRTTVPKIKGCSSASINTHVAHGAADNDFINIIGSRTI